PAGDSAAARGARARQLHNDAGRDRRARRGRRPVRLLRLSGRRPLPAYFEIDDALPARVERRETGGPGPGAPVPSAPAGAGAGPPLGQEVRDRVPGSAGAPDDMPDVLPKTGS
ncbi:hypothetical protein I6A84_16805, partial [Frankia sp. CNm7]|nr:hypothetical protein [Frankia nepalensis]